MAKLKDIAKVIPCEDGKPCDTVENKLMGFRAKIKEARTYDDLDTIYKELRPYTNRLTISSTMLLALFWQRAYQLYQDFNPKGKKPVISQNDIARRYDVTQGMVSKVFTALDNENYIVDVANGKIDLVGNSRATVRKEAKRLSYLDRAKKHIIALAKILHSDKVEASEKRLIREFGKEHIPSIFDTPLGKEKAQEMEHPAETIPAKVKKVEKTIDATIQ